MVAPLAIAGLAGAPALAALGAYILGAFDKYAVIFTMRGQIRISERFASVDSAKKHQADLAHKGYASVILEIKDNGKLDLHHPLRRERPHFPNFRRMKGVAGSASGCAECGLEGLRYNHGVDTTEEMYKTTNSAPVGFPEWVRRMRSGPYPVTPRDFRDTMNSHQYASDVLVARVPEKFYAGTTFRYAGMKFGRQA